jgi:hypothetical protein
MLARINPDHKGWRDQSSFSVLNKIGRKSHGPFADSFHPTDGTITDAKIEDAEFIRDLFQPELFPQNYHEPDYVPPPGTSPV